MADTLKKADGAGDYRGGASVDEVRSRVKAARVYKLSSNENPLGPSPLAVAAAKGALATLDLYPPRDDEDFRRDLAEFHALDKANFVTGHGAYEILELAARTLLKEGDEVIICPPTFGVYARTAKQAEATVVRAPLRTDFSLDVAGVLAAITERTRIVYLCNPNNPTGTVTSKGELERLLNALPKGALLIHDDVYGDFAKANDYPESMSYIRAAKPLMAVRTFSKSYGLAGLRLGYGVTTPELAERMRAHLRTFHLGSVSLAAGAAALRDQKHLQKSINVVLEGKRYLYEALAKLDVTYWPSEANFVLIKSPLNAAKLETDLLERGVMVRETARNGLPECLRVSIGTAEANEAFIGALTEILGNKS